MLRFKKSQLQLKTLPLPCLIIFHPPISHPLPPPSCVFSPFSSPIHCQEGPPAKGQFSTTRRRQRLAAAVATTVSGFQSQVEV